MILVYLLSSNNLRSDLRVPLGAAAPRHDKLHGEYLFRALQSAAIAYQFHVEANGVTRYGLSHAAIKSIWLPLPSLCEQYARFLDYADRRIRRYIRVKQHLIKLLEEQKQAIIHHAVTHGLKSASSPPAYRGSAMFRSIGKCEG